MQDKEYGHLAIIRFAHGFVLQMSIVLLLLDIKNQDCEAGEIIRLVASVRPSVDALTFEPFDL